MHAASKRVVVCIHTQHTLSNSSWVKSASCLPAWSSDVYAPLPRIEHRYGCAGTVDVARKSNVARITVQKTGQETGDADSMQEAANTAGLE